MPPSYIDTCHLQPPLVPVIVVVSNRSCRNTGYFRGIRGLEVEFKLNFSPEVNIARYTKAMWDTILILSVQIFKGDILKFIAVVY